MDDLKNQEREQLDEQDKAAEPIGQTEEKAPSEFEQLLDDLTEPDDPGEQEEQQEQQEQGEQGEQGEQEHGEEPVNAAPETPRPESKTTEEELLAEVKSERGQKRVRELVAGYKKLESEANELREVNQGVVEAITQTGMAPAELASTLEFCRLVGSDDEKNLRVAVEILEQQRKVLYQRLGEAAPGIDPLEGYPDLREKVEGMELSEEDALELARFRRMQAQQQLTTQQQQAMQRQEQEYAQHVNAFRQQAGAFFSSVATDPDYQAKEKKIAEYFQRPGKVQEFVQKFSPHQWLDQLKFMYENIPSPAPAPAKPQPLRSRPTTIGQQIDPALKGADCIKAVFDSLGI